MGGGEQICQWTLFFILSPLLQVLNLDCETSHTIILLFPPWCLITTRLSPNSNRLPGLLLHFPIKPGHLNMDTYHLAQTTLPTTPCLSPPHPASKASAIPHSNHLSTHESYSDLWAPGESPAWKLDVSQPLYQPGSSFKSYLWNLSQVHMACLLHSHNPFH